MAAQSCVHVQTATLVTTNADLITFTGKGRRLRVSNHDATNALYFRLDGQTAVADADENYVVMPKETCVLDGGQFGGTKISVVGSANKYTVAIY